MFNAEHVMLFIGLVISTSPTALLCSSFRGMGVDYDSHLSQMHEDMELIVTPSSDELRTLSAFGSVCES